LRRMGVEQKPLFVTQVDKLEAKIQALCHESLLARQSSYSPYSQFAVGAALLCADGTTILGCNVENASYGLAICAERTAAVKAVSGGQQDFVAIAIAAQAGEQFVGPCGACRQFMAEFNPDIPIYLVRPDLVVQVTNLNVLLPEAFTPRRMDLKFHNSKGSKESNGTRESNGIGAGTNGINGTNGTNGVN